jgi:hypothetical protein
MFLKQRGFKALSITKGFNFSPVALQANIIAKRSFRVLFKTLLEDAPLAESVFSGNAR